jgi:hypothetical protein
MKIGDLFLIFGLMAFGGIWQHGKYSYGVWQWFAYNSDNFEKWPKIEKRKQFSPATGFGPRPYKRFFLPAKAPPSCLLRFFMPRHQNWPDSTNLLAIAWADF